MFNFSRLAIALLLCTTSLPGASALAAESDECPPKDCRDEFPENRRPGSPEFGFTPPEDEEGAPESSAPGGASR